MAPKRSKTMKRIVIILIAAAVLSAAGSQANTAQAQEYGVVDISAAYMRSAPDYESSLECQALMGTVVTIIESDRYWLHVVFEDPLYYGWVTEMGIARMSEEEIAAYRKARKAICRAAHSAVYADASEGEQICDLTMGDVMRDLGTKGAFAKVRLPSGKIGYAPTKDLMFGYPADPSSMIVKTAREFNGVPYLWGGNTAGALDCSGLVWLTYRINGIILPRNASEQAQEGNEVALADARPGDLLYFGAPYPEPAAEMTPPAFAPNGIAFSSADGHINAVDAGFHPSEYASQAIKPKDMAPADPPKVTHIGIYLGDGKFIHASQKVYITDLEHYTSKKLLGVRRIL